MNDFQNNKDTVYLSDNSKISKYLLIVFYVICFVNILGIVSGYFEMKLLQT